MGTAHGFGVGAGERDLTQASSLRAAPACSRTDGSTGTRPLPSPSQSPSPPSGMVEAGSRPWATIREGLRGGAENSQEWAEQSAGAATAAVSRRRQVPAGCGHRKSGPRRAAYRAPVSPMAHELRKGTRAPVAGAGGGVVGQRVATCRDRREQWCGVAAGASVGGAAGAFVGALGCRLLA